MKPIFKIIFKKKFKNFYDMKTITFPNNCLESDITANIKLTNCFQINDLS